MKQVLGLFNSSIQIESNPGNGTRFFFTISFTTTTAVPKKEIAKRAVKTDLGHLKILIAEDNEFNRRIIAMQFRALNLVPVIVENGKQAYDTYASGHFDAILLDLHMPVSDGYETVKQIRAMKDPEKAKVYIIAFTASVTEQQKIFDSGFDDYLYKPVELNALINKLEKAGLYKRA